MSAIAALTCDNESGPGGVGSTSRGLTHLSDYGGRGLGVSLPIEQWRPVLGFEGLYEVSNHGRVRGLDRRVPLGDDLTRLVRGRDLVIRVDANRHLIVDLSKDGKRCRRWVHVLVLEAFVGPRPPGLECCHNDGVPTNNILSNLRWDTRSANQQDAVAHGAHVNSRKTHCLRGHPLSGENLRVDGRGRRGCRRCATNLLRLRRQARRALDGGEQA